MAAAQMHSEGRLVQASDHTGFRPSDNIEDRRDESSLGVRLKNAVLGDSKMSDREEANWADDQPTQLNNPMARSAGLLNLYKGGK